MKNLILAILIAAAAPTAAHAAPASSRGGNSLSFWGILDPGPWDGYGAGFRVGLPLAPQGILHARVRDELVLEFGADLVHYSVHDYWGPYGYDYSWTGLLPVAGVAWNFWFTPQLALYPKIDAGWWLGWYRGWNGNYPYYYTRHEFDGLFLQAAGGLIYKLDRVALRVELGSGLFRAGVAIPF